jgi:hypothetical protein
MGNHGLLDWEKYREEGVHKPTTKSKPAPTPKISRTTILSGGAASMLAIPKQMNAAPVSSRKSRRPTPGQPLAKVENSRCKTLLFRA